MASTDVIQGERQKLYEDRAYLVLSEVVKSLITAWMPAFTTGILGWVLGWCLPLILRPISRALAKEANWLRLSYQSEVSLKSYNAQKDALRALESLYTGGELTPQEKQANVSFDKAADDYLNWPE